MIETFHGFWEPNCAHFHKPNIILRSHSLGQNRIFCRWTFENLPLVLCVPHGLCVMSTPPRNLKSYWIPCYPCLIFRGWHFRDCHSRILCLNSGLRYKSDIIGNAISIGKAIKWLLNSTGGQPQGVCMEVRWLKLSSITLVWTHPDPSKIENIWKFLPVRFGRIWLMVRIWVSPGPCLWSGLDLSRCHLSATFLRLSYYYTSLLAYLIFAVYPVSPLVDLTFSSFETRKRWMAALPHVTCGSVSRWASLPTFHEACKMVFEALQ